MLPANPDTLSRAEVKAAFRRHHGEKSRLATAIREDLPRISEWFTSDKPKTTPMRKKIDLAIRQRAADLINAERSKAQGGCE